MLNSRMALRLARSVQARPVSAGISATRPFSNTSVARALVSEAIKEDHREIQEAYNKIRAAKDLDTKQRWQNQFIWELARHSVGEELVVYPAIQKYLRDGKVRADKDREQHQSVQEYLKAFEKLQPQDSEFESTLDALWTDLTRHIKEEEENDLPALEAALSQPDSESIAKSFERTKMFAPTRSHPNAPRTPAFETAAGMLAAPLDRLKDMFTKFPEK